MSRGNGWFASVEDPPLAAIYINGNSVASWRLFKKGDGIIAIEHNNLYIFSCYISPNCEFNVFNQFLSTLDTMVTGVAGNVIVAGDFNARARAWDLVDNLRGRTLLSWATGIGMYLLNESGTNTCLRWQGESVVDLTWCSSGILERIVDWRVKSNLETLSDHLYNTFKIKSRPIARARPKGSCFRTWNYKKFNKDLFVAFLENYCWNHETSARNVEVLASEMNKLVTAACKLAMPYN